MNKNGSLGLAFLWVAGLAGHTAFAAAPLKGCPGDNGGLSLPPGFCATVFADHVGHTRHMAIAKDGTVYVNTWSGDYYTYGHVDKLPDGGFLVALRDTHGTGHADVIKRFGDGVAQGSAGGTGIALYNNALYAEVNDRIDCRDRFAMPWQSEWAAECGACDARGSWQQFARVENARAKLVQTST